MPDFKLATRPKPYDPFDPALITNSEMATFKLAKHQKPLSDSAFEAMRETEETGTFQKSKPFKKGVHRFKRGDRIRIRGREHEVLHIEPFPDGQSYVHARSATGDIQGFYPDSEIHAA